MILYLILYPVFNETNFLMFDSMIKSRLGRLQKQNKNLIIKKTSPSIFLHDHHCMTVIPVQILATFIIIKLTFQLLLLFTYLAHVSNFPQHFVDNTISYTNTKLCLIVLVLQWTIHPYRCCRQEWFVWRWTGGHPVMWWWGAEWRVPILDASCSKAASTTPRPSNCWSGWVFRYKICNYFLRDFCILFLELCQIVIIVKCPMLCSWFWVWSSSYI